MGSVSLIAATMIYGFFAVLARVVGYTIPIFYQNMTREIVATGILGILLVTGNRAWKKLTPRAWLWVILRAILGCVAFLLFFYCMNTMEIGTAYFLFYGSSTVIGYLLGKFLFDEHMNPIKWISLMFAFFGLILIYSINMSHLSLLLVGSAIVSGAATALWYNIVKKLDTYPSKQLTFLDNSIPILWYVVLSLMAGETWVMPQANIIWIASLGYGALFVVTGQLIIYGYQRLDAQIATILMLGEIPFALLFAYLFYQETLRPLTIIGGTVIIGAIILPELPMIKKRKMHKKI